MARVLVVDDLPGMRAVAAMILRNAGHEVEVAAGGREALDRIRQHPPDLVLLDLHMPQVSGFEVLEELRGGAWRTPMPVVVFSARDDAESRQRAARLGAAGFVTKRAADAYVLREEVDRHIKVTGDSKTTVPMGTARRYIAGAGWYP